jgi:hypothetical protein
VAAPHALNGLADLADRRLGPRGRYRALEQIAVPGARRLGEGPQRCAHGRRIALGLEAGQLGDLAFAHGSVVDPQHLDLCLVGHLKLVDANDRLGAAIDAGLRACRGLLDAHLRDAGGDCFGHAAQLLDFRYVRLRLAHELVGEPFDKVAAAPRIDRAAGAGLLQNKELRVAGDAGGEVGG